MLRMLLHWFVSALAVWLTSRVVPGFQVTGASASLIAALVIGLVNATLTEQFGEQRFYQRFSAFQNTELSNSLSPPAEPGIYQCNYRAG